MWRAFSEKPPNRRAFGETDGADRGSGLSAGLRVAFEVPVTAISLLSQDACLTAAKGLGRQLNKIDGRMTTKRKGQGKDQ